MTSSSESSQGDFEFKCIRVSQPIGDFYIASIPFQKLRQLAYADQRRLERERDLDTYLGIQRPLSQKRISELKLYVKQPDATFPTSIVVAVDERCVAFANRPNGDFTIRFSEFAGDDETPAITLREIAKVLDGQHRIEGLEDFTGDFELNVCIFVGADIADQANIFATVNLEQTKVNKSLALDLLAYSRVRTPEKTAHDVAILLDMRAGSPYKDRIKRLGVATPGRSNERISQATFVDALLAFISNDARADRVELLNGRKLKEYRGDSFRRPFRNHFIQGHDAQIAVSLLNFFDCVRAKWNEAWESNDEGVMIARTNGFRAFMRFLRGALERDRLTYASPEWSMRLLAAIDLRDRDFTKANFPPGTGGEAALYRSLSAGSLNRGL